MVFMSPVRCPADSFQGKTLCEFDMDVNEQGLHLIFQIHLYM